MEFKKYVLNKKVHSHRFSYDTFGQDLWKVNHTSCDGEFQSPIKIDSYKATPIRMPALELIRYQDLLPGPLRLHNNGHSGMFFKKIFPAKVIFFILVSLEIPTFVMNTSKTQFIPYLFGAYLKHEYVFQGLHFHWGNKNNEGSEHVYNDIRFPMEMHLIHRNRKYDSEEALKNKDGLVVLAFFCQVL